MNRQDKIETIIDAIGDIDPVYVKEAEEWKAKSSVSSIRRYGKRLLPLAACLALLVAGGTYSLWNPKSEMETNKAAATNSAAGESASHSTYEDSYFAEEEMAESVKTIGISEDDIFVNEIEELESAVYCGEAPEREVYYTASELESYYGVRVMPNVLPEGLTLVENAEKYVIGYDKEDHVIDDNCTIRYADDSAERELTISVRTVLAGEVTSFAQENLTSSWICGTKVTIGHDRTKDDADAYIAIFEQNGVTFTVMSQNLTQTEMVDILKDLLAE